MFYHYLLLIFVLFHLAYSLDLPECDPINAMYLKVTQRKLVEAYHKSKDRCTYLSLFRQKVSYKGEDDIQYHAVCYDPDMRRNIVFVEASITREDNIAHGTKVSEAVRHRLKEFAHKCGADEAGHIIPREFGGLGIEENVFNQNHHLNRGPRPLACREIKFFFEKDVTGNAHVHMRIAFFYEDPNYPHRPSIYYYSFAFFDGVELVHQTYGFFENSDHLDINLNSCWKGKDKYVFVEKLNAEYYQRRECAPNPNPIKSFYGPTPINN